MKIDERQLVEALAVFLKRTHLVECESHFGGDNADKADIELCLSANRWPQNFPRWLFIEAKSHHSKDSPNTINKIFGQLLKETGKSRRERAKNDFALAIAFPSEPGGWTDSGRRQVTRLDGEAYYRQGFSRIDRSAYVAFGELVKARYVFSFSCIKEHLRVFDWVGFLDGVEPLVVLPGARETE